MKRGAWSYYRGFYKGRYRIVFLAVVLSVIQAGAVVPVMELVRRVVDNVIPAGDKQMLVVMCSALLGFTFLSVGLGLVTRRMTLMLNTKVIKGMREDLVTRHYDLSLTYMSKSDRSKLHTILLQDIGRIESMGNVIVATTLPSFFVSIIISWYMLYLNWHLFLVPVFILPLLFFTTHRMSLELKERVDAFRKSFQRLSKRMWFALWQADLTRFQSAQDFEIRRQSDGLNEFRDQSVKMAWWQATLNAVQRSLTGAAGILVLVVGGMAIADKEMTIGDLMAFLVAARMLQAYANPLFSAVATIVAGNESLQEVYRLVDTDAKLPYNGNGHVDFTGRIAMKNVYFGYDGVPVLKGASLRIDPGELVVLLGPNGAGKSTIANLVLGFYRPDQGVVEAEGRPFDELEILSLRRHMGVVPQSPGIFGGTILENITYGYPDTKLEQVIDAAKRAGAHRFISELADGYDSGIGDDGVTLSGGERQLIAISRTLLRDPKLLILDEPTNHLSKEAVRNFWAMIASERHLRATLIISHHWEIAKEADRVYYLENGDLQEVSKKDLSKLESLLASEA